MVENKNTLGQPTQAEIRHENSGETHDSPAPLRREMIRTRLIVAFSFALITLAVNLAFFTVMSSGAPVMSRVVLGRSITLANVLGVGIILFYLTTVLVFERFTRRPETRSSG